jgi:hypothetical protein
MAKIEFSEKAREELARETGARKEVIPEILIAQRAVVLAEAEIARCHEETRRLIQASDRTLERLRHAEAKCYAETVRADAWKAASEAWHVVCSLQHQGIKADTTKNRARELEAKAERSERIHTTLRLVEETAVKAAGLSESRTSADGELWPAHGRRE